MKIFTYGVFDLLHKGHIDLLWEVREMADELKAQMIVGVFTDKVAESFKRKPVMNIKERIDAIEALRIANKIVEQHELSPNYLINILEIDKIVKGPGADYETIKVPCEKILLDYHGKISTSEIIKRIKLREDL
jgi:cytidyltransferase-like protein